VTNKLALVVAVVLGVLSILGIKLYVDKIKNEVEQKTQMGEVLVAGRDLRQGEVLDVKDLERLKLPRIAIDAYKRTNIENADTVIGAKTTTEIRQGQVLQTYHFAQKQTGRTMGQIGTDWRAVTVPVTPITGLCGLLRPGDFVDVIVCFELKAEHGSAIQFTRTLVKKCLVLATDSHTDPNAESRLVDYATVTLKLRSNDVNKVVFAVGRQQHIQLAKLDDTSAEAGTWDAVSPDMMYEEVAPELKKGK
jgi:pilus assembly protein CpaB